MLPPLAESENSTPLPLVVVLSLLLTQFSKTHATDCPIQCHCVPKRMSCEVPGLKQLPEPFSPQLDFLLVENQTFDSTHLGPSELSVYRTIEFGGQVRLKSLHIRFCNIRTIGRNAFETLGLRLELLDLTGNPLKHISDYAFSGLGQLTLILDKLDQPPAFDDFTFSGLVRMKSLIMRNSKLVTLPYQPLLQLTKEGKLDKIFLKGNQFTRLDSKYDQIFSQLQDFEINDNPWHCDCQLTWLIRRHRTMLLKRTNAYQERKRRWNTQLMSNWEMEEDNRPKCASPPGLASRNFSDLVTDINDLYTHPASMHHSPNIVYCPPPQLESLDVLIESLGEDNSTSVNNQVVSKSKKPSVKLKCTIRGSRLMQVTWMYHPPGSGPQTLDKSRILTDGTALSNEYGSSNNDLARSESHVLVERITESDTYSCFGNDVIGNVSTLVRINWPTVPPSGKKIPMRITSEPPMTNHSRAPVTSDWSKEMLLSSDSVLHTPQFSLSQLMGAIVGTFLATVLLFLAIHCTLHWRSSLCPAHKARKPEQAILVGHASVSPAGTSSSNTSSSNARLISSPKLNEVSTMSMPLHMNSEALLATKNLLNAHLLQQAINSSHSLDYPNISMAPSSLEHSLNAQLRYHTSMPPGSNAIPVAYEPVAYSDANNLTYDVPWMVNMNRTNPMHFQTNQQQLHAEQQLPLLFNHQLAIPNQALVDRNSMLSAATLQIPPPPSIPQPSLPGTPSTLTMNNDTLNRTASNGTNLMLLQTSYPNHGSLLQTTVASSSQQPNCSTG